MKTNTEYQIYIGCRDGYLHDEIISDDALREMITQFFRKKEIDFSIYSTTGGYLHEDGVFVSEKTLCINIIGANELDIIKLAKSLSMFMNQEYSLVVKDMIKAEYC